MLVVMRCTSEVMRASWVRLRWSRASLAGLSAGLWPNQGLRDHHLADHVHQLIELDGVDADGGGVAGAALN